MSASLFFKGFSRLAFRVYKPNYHTLTKSEGGRFRARANMVFWIPTATKPCGRPNNSRIVKL